MANADPVLRGSIASSPGCVASRMGPPHSPDVVRSDILNDDVARASQIDRSGEYGSRDGICLDISHGRFETADLRGEPFEEAHQLRHPAREALSPVL